MPVVANRYFNDPNIGQAFSNLASAFGPPSGGDLAGYASARAKQEEASRLAQLFDYAQNPQYNREAAERMAVAAGIYNPTQSYYAVDQGNLTTRRGQDVTAQTSIFNNAADNRTVERGQDITSRTSILNNGADNRTVLEKAGLDNTAAMDRRRAQDAISLLMNSDDNAQLGQNNAADNARALQQTQLANTKDLGVAMLAPVGKDATRFVPKSLADMYGTDERQTGVVSAQPGEVNTLPDGRVIRGDAKPLSETEWMAKQQQAAMDAGLITPQMIADMANGKNNPVTVLKNDVPTFMNPGEAARTGATAYQNRAEAKVTNGQAILNGKPVAVVQRPGESVWRTMDGTPIPNDAQVTNMATPTGSNTDLGLGPTQTNITSGRTLNASLDMAEFTANKAKELLRTNPNAAGMTAKIKGIGQSVVGSLKQVMDAAGQVDPNAPLEMEQARDMLTKATNVVGEYDPDVVRMFSLVADMAYARAQINNPQGEVSRQAFERSLESFGQGFFASQQDLATGIDSFLQDTIPAGRIKAGSLMGQKVNAQPVNAAPAIQDGATATNPKTGEKIVYRNGAWGPAQ